MKPSPRSGLARVLIYGLLAALGISLAACSSPAPAAPPAQMCADNTTNVARAGIPLDTTMFSFQELTVGQATVVQECLQANPAVIDAARDDDTSVFYTTGGVFQNVIDDNSEPADPHYVYYQALWGLAVQIDDGNYPAMSVAVRDVLLNTALRLDPETGEAHQAYRLEGDRLVPQMGPVVHRVDNVITDDTDPADTALFVGGHSSHSKKYHKKPTVPPRVAAPVAPVRRPTAVTAPQAGAGGPAVGTTRTAVPPAGTGNTAVKPTSKATTTTTTTTAAPRCTSRQKIVNGRCVRR